MNIPALLRRAEQWLLDLVYPRRVICLCCRERSGGEFFCDECRRRLQRRRRRESRLGDIGLAVDAAELRAVWHYRGEAAQLVRQLKFHCVGDAAEVMADAIAQEVRKTELPPDTIVTSVAMPEKRIRQRGIDHGRVLAEKVAQRLELPYQALLTRAPGGHTQRGLGRERRIRNLSGRFAGVRQTGEPVLLIDDVLTTGATAAVCTRALLDAGSGPVYVVVAACADRRKKGHV